MTELGEPKKRTQFCHASSPSASFDLKKIYSMSIHTLTEPFCGHLQTLSSREFIGAQFEAYEMRVRRHNKKELKTKWPASS